MYTIRLQVFKKMRLMISHSEFYNRLLKAKEKEALLKEREVKALESIAESLKRSSTNNKL